MKQSTFVLYSMAFLAVGFADECWNRNFEAAWYAWAAFFWALSFYREITK